MKRVILLVVLIFLGLSPSFSAGDYELDAPPTIQARTTEGIKTAPPAVKSSNPMKTAKDPKKQGGIKGFFNRILYPKQKQRPKFDEPGGGYSGTLPNLESEFKYKTPKSSPAKDKGENAENYLPEEFEPSKLDDPLFLDVILNKERPSQYNLDMLRIMKFLEIFRPVVENHDPVQKFNANVNLLDLHTRRIEKLYSDKPESLSPSYYKLLDLSYKAKVLGNLKFDANYYSKFSPVQGTQYAQENLINEDNKLLRDIDQTIFEIQQLSN